MRALWVPPWRPGLLAGFNRPVVDLVLPGDRLPEPRRAWPVECVCGRLLTDPVSRARGLGPVCARRLSAPTAPAAPSAATSLTPVPHVLGQTALDLDHQPTLWSV